MKIEFNISSNIIPFEVFTGVSAIKIGALFINVASQEIFIKSNTGLEEVKIFCEGDWLHRGEWEKDVENIVNRFKNKKVECYKAEAVQYFNILKDYVRVTE